MFEPSDEPPRKGEPEEPTQRIVYFYCSALIPLVRARCAFEPSCILNTVSLNVTAGEPSITTASPHFDPAQNDIRRSLVEINPYLL